MATKERQYYLPVLGTVQRQKLDDDIDRILQLYNDHGYIQARVESHEIVPDRARKQVTIRDRGGGGAAVPVGHHHDHGQRDPPDRGAPPARAPSRPATSSPAARCATASGRSWTSTGARPGLGRRRSPDSNDLANLKVDVTFEIIEGPRSTSSGSTSPATRAARRRSCAASSRARGRPLHAPEARAEPPAAVNLGYFEQVNVDHRAGSTPDKIIVNIDVTERPTGLFSIGGGYSCLDSFFATLDVSQRNFLGRGWEVVPPVPRRRAEPAGHHRLHRALALRHPAPRGVRHLRPRAGVRRLHGRAVRRGHPGEPSVRGVHGAVRASTGSRTSTSPTSSPYRERGPEEGAGDEPQLGGRVHPGAGHPRQHLRARPGAAGTRWSSHFAGLGGDTQFYKVIAESAWFVPLPVFNLVWAVRGLGRVRPRAGAARRCRSSSGSSWAAPTRSAASGRGRSPRRTTGAR